MSGKRIVLCGFDSEGWVADQLCTALIEHGHQIVGWASARTEARATQLSKTFYYGGRELSSVSEQSQFVRMQRSDEEELTLGFLLHRDSPRHFNIYDEQAKRSLMEWRLSEFLKDSHPDLVLFEESPHNTVDYLTYLIARDLGVPTLFVIESPVPQAFVAVDRFDEQLVAQGSKPIIGRSLSEQAQHYVSRLQADYTSAEPIYEREHREQSGATKVLLRKTTRTLSKLRGSRNPSFAGTLADYRVWRQQRYYESALEALTVDTSPTPAVLGSSVVVFLHLQPERSTVPECGVYANQVAAISHLRSLLSKDVRIFVREHPSTLSYRIGFVRTANYLSIIHSIPGVDLIDSRLPPFDIIDNCLAVCTGTGTVGFEAIVRGTPAIVFGMARYRGMSGVVDLESIPPGADERYFGQHKPEHAEIVQALTALESSPRHFSIDGPPRSAAYRAEYVRNVVRLASEARTRGT